MIKRLTLLIAAVMLFFLSGCGDDNDGRNGQFNVTIAENPYNLDPQTADGREAAFVIKNIYGTLMDIDSRGMVVCGTAESYSVSPDGLEYNFVLRDGLCWQGISSGSEKVHLTAYDYEYAFRRIYDPQTQSPHTKRFDCIKNSMSLYNGETSADSFGVKANDEQSLTISLDSPNCEFLKLLAHSAASPCNEQLFLSTQGRYGLSADDTYACGAFYVSDWNYDPYWNDNHITLEKINSNSIEGYETFPLTVNIKIADSSQGNESSEKSVTHAYTLKNISRYDKNVQRNYSCSEYVCGVSCLTVSPEYMSNDSVRRAIMNSVDMETICRDLNENSLPASGVFPNAVTIMNKSFRELYPEKALVRSISVTGLPENSGVSFNNSVLLASDSLNSESEVYNIADDFYSTLKLDCMTEFEPDNVFKEKISSGEYDFCIVTVLPEYNLAEEFISELKKYIWGDADISDAELSQKIAELSQCGDLTGKMNHTKDIEDYLTDNSYLLPLSFEKKYFICHKNVSDLWYDPFTDVMYFKYAKQF